MNSQRKLLLFWIIKYSSKLLNNLNSKKELLYKDIISVSRKINYLLYNNQDNQILLFKNGLMILN